MESLDMEEVLGVLRPAEAAVGVALYEYEETGVDNGPSGRAKAFDGEATLLLSSTMLLSSESRLGSSVLVGESSKTAGDSSMLLDLWPLILPFCEARPRPGPRPCPPAALSSSSAKPLPLLPRPRPRRLGAGCSVRPEAWVCSGTSLFDVAGGSAPKTKTPSEAEGVPGSPVGYPPERACGFSVDSTGDVSVHEGEDDSPKIDGSGLSMRSSLLSSLPTTLLSTLHVSEVPRSFLRYAVTSSEAALRRSASASKQTRKRL
mmetsp:Transcript_56885/g.123062  ORF Transcript_56885/g.123062 Transcript_56885/m.123062 type:complete len:260 (+) Transcript_56885:1748-2527(+)